MRLLYIKANGTYYRPQEPGVQDPERHKGHHLPVCIIKKMSFGRWQVDFHDRRFEDDVLSSEDAPNSRIILYPNGIEEIRYAY